MRQPTAVATPNPASQATLSAVTPTPALPALQFGLPDLFQPEVVHSLGAYKGRPVILNFWASWCEPCRSEMPLLNSLYEAERGSGLVVLGINETFVDSLSQAQQLASELDLTFPLALDEAGHVSERMYRATNLPTSIFITRDGHIMRTHVGQLTQPLLRQYVSELMALP